MATLPTVLMATLPTVLARALHARAMVTGTDRRQQVSDTSPRRVFRVSSPRSSSIQPNTTTALEPRRTKGKKTPKNEAAPQARAHSCPPIEVDAPQEGTGSPGLGATARRRQKKVSDSLQNRQILAHPDKFLQKQVAEAERKARLGVVTADLEHLSRDSSSLLMLRLSSKVETFEQRAALQSTELEQARLQAAHWKAAAQKLHAHRGDLHAQLGTARDALAQANQAQEHLWREVAHSVHEREYIYILID